MADSLDSGTSHFHVATLQDLFQDPESLQFACELGDGEFAIVEKGETACKKLLCHTKLSEQCTCHTATNAAVGQRLASGRDTIHIMRC